MLSSAAIARHPSREAMGILGWFAGVAATGNAQQDHQHLPEPDLAIHPGAWRKHGAVDEQMYRDMVIVLSGEMFALLRLARGQISGCGPAVAHDDSAE
jgi:hypothetical protein